MWGSENKNPKDHEQNSLMCSVQGPPGHWAIRSLDV